MRKYFSAGESFVLWLVGQTVCRFVGHTPTEEFHVTVCGRCYAMTGEDSFEWQERTS